MEILRIAIAGSIEQIKPEGDAIKIFTTETLCSAGEAQGSNRKCTYTLGVIWGALELANGRLFASKYTEFVLRGGSDDVFNFTELSWNTKLGKA